MRERLFKLFFNDYYRSYKYYKREHDIMCCSISLSSALDLLPKEVEGGKFNPKKWAYIDTDGEVVFQGSSKSHRSQTQNIVALYLELQDAGYIVD